MEPTEHHPCAELDCKARITRIFIPTGQYYCRKHMGEMDEVQTWVENWIKQHYKDRDFI